MNVLVTGATGYLGGPAAEALAAAGHRVHAVAHSEAVERAVRAAGWQPVAADLRSGSSLTAAAAAADAVIHAANTGGPDAAAVDAAATRALLAGLRGTGGPFVYTSGIWVLGATQGADETTPAAPIELVGWRGDLEREVLGSVAAGVRPVVLRPALAYGRGAGVPGAVAEGVLPVVGAGDQRWPLVHVDDLARLYVLALAAPAVSVLHGVGTAATMWEIALLGRAARGAAGPPERVSLAEARSRLGAFADALALGQEVSAARTRALTGWRPSAPSLVAEFLAGSYRRAA